MSGAKPFEVQKWAIAQKLGKNKTLHKLLLMALAIHADSEGYAYPSQRLLAEMAECTRTTANEHLRWLRDQGLIAYRPRHREDGGQSSNEYLVLFRDDLRWRDGAAPGHRGKTGESVGGGDTPVLNSDDPSWVVPAPLSDAADTPLLARRDTKNHIEEPKEEPKETAASAREHEADVPLARQRVETFVDQKLIHGIGKPEYREQDINKPEWLKALHDLDDRSAGDFSAALGQACSRSDAEWRKRFAGPRSAQAFVGDFDRLLPKARGASFLEGLQ